jgi:hypothetical protein
VFGPFQIVLTEQVDHYYFRMSLSLLERWY